MARAIETLSKDPALRARLARAAMVRVRREFDVNECESLFHQRVQSAITDPRPRAARERTA